MNKITHLFAVVGSLCFFSVSHAVVIISNDYENIEGANIEILHNSEKNSGTVIVRKNNCNACAPITLNYQKNFDFSINGIQKAFSPETPSISTGDISYKPEDMSVGHVNFYQ